MKYDYADAYKYRAIAHSKLADNQRAREDLSKAAYLYSIRGNTNDLHDVLERFEKLRAPEPVPREVK